MENELYHHGILGQKWGVRRFQNKDGSLTSAGKARYKTDGKTTGQEETVSNSTEKKAASEKEATAKNTKTASDMTDEELKQAVNRLQLEQRYKELSKNAKVEDKTVAAWMKKTVTEQLKKSGEKAIGKAFDAVFDKTLKSFTGDSKDSTDTSDKKKDKATDSDKSSDKKTGSSGKQGSKSTSKTEAASSKDGNKSKTKATSTSSAKASNSDSSAKSASNAGHAKGFVGQNGGTRTSSTALSTYSTAYNFASQYYDQPLWQSVLH